MSDRFALIPHAARDSSRLALLISVWACVLLAGCRQSGPTVKPSALSESPDAPAREPSAEISADVPDPDDTEENTPLLAKPAVQTYSGEPHGTGVKPLPTPSVFGSGGNARKIAFVIDASGSMVDVLPFIIKITDHVIKDLEPEQKITVIAFSGDGVFEVPGGTDGKGLRSTTDQFKTKVTEWLNMDNFQYSTGGSGGEHAQAAVLKALSYKPQLLYVMSVHLNDAGKNATQFETDQDKLIKAVAKANNTPKPAKINTVQFVGKDPLAKAGLKGTLQRLAEEHNGKYQFVSAKELVPE